MDSTISHLLQQGTVIPAHPLVLNQTLEMNESRQRLLTRYYIASGAGGVAVGVHTTQFEIRNPEINLLDPVLKVVADEIENAGLKRPFIKVAGICGPTAQAIREAELSVKYGYHLGLLSMGGLNDYTEEELIERARVISEIIPVFGFYLQPAVGGRKLSYRFWKAFAEIKNVRAIKIAAFNRYQTLDVVRAVCHSSRVNDIALYTGNDDNIVADLLTPYQFTVNGQLVEKKIVGGLLGHWAVWTTKAVELLNEIKMCIADGYKGVDKLLAKGIQITDMNAALFDTDNAFKGCIAGIHEVLRRQGLIKGTWCLNPEERMSPGQAEELDRVCAMYPWMTDDLFAENILKQAKHENVIE